MFALESAGAAELAVGVLRIALGLLALGVLFCWGWLAEPLERQVRLMGAVFEADYANLSTKTKIRAIVLVTMLSLLLELVLIRWLASVFPVYSFYKNFTMLACFLGLGAGYAVAEKQPCAPALVLPMLALFVGVITLLRYDTGAAYLIFSIGWLSTFDLPVYFLLGASFIVCACICYPVGQLCGKLLHSSNSLNAYSLNLIGSILGVIALFVMSLYWLPPVIWFAVIGGIMLLFVLSRDAVPVRRHRQLLRAAGDPGLAGAAGDAADLFAVPVAGAHRQGRRADADPVGRQLLPEGLQFRRRQARPGIRRRPLCPRLLRVSVQLQEGAGARRHRRLGQRQRRRDRVADGRVPMSTPSRSIPRSPFSAPNIIRSVPTTIRASTCRSTMRATSSAPPTSNTI